MRKKIVKNCVKKPPKKSGFFFSQLKKRGKLIS